MIATAATIATGSLLDGTRGLTAQIADVDHHAWQEFVHALTIGDDDAVRSFRTKSASGGFGCFDLRPRRLADLNVMRDVRLGRTPEGRQIYVGVFVRPMTETKFLASPLAQYNVLVESLRLYDLQLAELGALPDGLSRSGALALLHRTGPQGLANWAKWRRPATIALVERTNHKF